MVTRVRSQYLGPLARISQQAGPSCRFSCLPREMFCAPVIHMAHFNHPLMSSRHSTRRMISLLPVVFGLAMLVVGAGGAVLWFMWDQQTRIRGDAQQIYDVSSPLIFEATRTIRGLERLAREGNDIPLLANPHLRRERRELLGALQEDATLQGDEQLRALVARAFATLDLNMSLASRAAPNASQQIQRQWQPVMAALLDRSEVEGAKVSALALKEADNTIQSTDDARRVLLGISVALSVLLLVILVFIHIGIIRPVIFVSRNLVLARRGRVVPYRNIFIRELMTLHEAAEALSSAHSILKTHRKRLDELAHTDVLTNLGNRRLFEKVGAQLFADAKRNNRSIAVVAFDIDHFKLINDNHGHEGGDAVLQALGHYLARTIRTSDGPVARTGGEEFALILSHAGEAEAVEMAERLRVGVSALQVAMSSGALVTFTISLGVTQYDARDHSLQDMVRRADAALYKAKAAGRNCFELATLSPTDEGSGRRV